MIAVSTSGMPRKNRWLANGRFGLSHMTKNIISPNGSTRIVLLSLCRSERSYNVFAISAASVVR